jgi:maleylpyruvate isomerase
MGHVLTHLARNADAMIRRIEGVLAGEMINQYVGGVEGRSQEISTGADRPAAEVVADVDSTARRLDATSAELPDQGRRWWPPWEAVSIG